MLDIFISASLAALTMIMAYLGVHVTLHPPTNYACTAVVQDRFFGLWCARRGACDNARSTR